MGRVLKKREGCSSALCSLPWSSSHVCLLFVLRLSFIRLQMLRMPSFWQFLLDVCSHLVQRKQKRYLRWARSSTGAFSTNTKNYAKNNRDGAMENEGTEDGVHALQV